MTITSSKSLWAKRGKRFRNRGVKGIGAFVARAELEAAAKLWDTDFSSVQGWVADIGAGNGLLWDIVKRKPDRLLLSDISRAYNMSSPSCCRMIADGEAMPIRRNSLNSIVALGLIEYIVELDIALEKWSKLTKAGGLLLLSNSPKTLPNRLRAAFGFGAIPRDDVAIINALTHCGWEIVCDPVRAGWQTLFVAKRSS